MMNSGTNYRPHTGLNSPSQGCLLVLVQEGERSAFPLCLCAEHVRRRLGCKSPTNLMEVKVSEAQGRDREEASERSVEQRREPMYKNRIRGRRLRTSWQMAAKSITIKAVGCKFGGCALKVVELTSGDLPFVVESRLGSGQPVPTGRQKSAAGVLVRKRMKAQTVLRKEGNGRDK